MHVWTSRRGEKVQQNQRSLLFPVWTGSEPGAVPAARTCAAWRSWRSICAWFPSPGCWEGWRWTTPRTDISMRTETDQNRAGGSELPPAGLLTLMQMPQPMQRDSEIHTILLCGVTSMHSLPAGRGRGQRQSAASPVASCGGRGHSPMRTTGQLFLHSWRHFLGLHLSWLTMAILVFLSAMMEGEGGAALTALPPAELPNQTNKRGGVCQENYEEIWTLFQFNETKTSWQ